MNATMLAAVTDDPWLLVLVILAIIALVIFIVRRG